ncbi:leucine-rich repeat domain-containing protein, partial [Pandoraea pneumonica]|uniref:leucine-rich repeat domain-containing protein n=1 Tax=Pandoraea pneumonica TaxID=2508299 RepID=UPI003CEC26FD
RLQIIQVPKSLQKLFAQENDINKVFVEQAPFHRLEILNLSNNNLTRLDKIFKLERLRSLDVSRNNIEDLNIERFYKLPALVNFNISASG